MVAHKKVASRAQPSLLATSILFGIIGLAIGMTVALTVFAARQKVAPLPVNVSISNIKHSGATKGYFNAGPGNEYVTVTVKVHNGSNQAIDLAPAVQSRLVDGSGKIYGVVIYMVTKPFIAGELKPGETREGQLAFIAPLKPNGLTFIMKDSLSPTMMSFKQVL